MPEGDTVWLTAQRLHTALAGQPLTSWDLRVPRLATTDLRGSTVTAVVARGKHLLMRFDDGRTLHSHLRMDGSWVITRAGQRPRHPPAHLIRAQLGTARWLATGYRVHDLELIGTSDEGRLVGHLGPDLLGPDWDLDEAARRLRLLPDRAISEALLDQRALAGIGNLYACESLFVAGVHPDTPVGAVADLAGLVNTARRLLLANREHAEQSTTGMLARGRQHWVYRRPDEPCLRCGTPIVRQDASGAASGRQTFWCPTCQPLRSAGEAPQA